MDTISNFLNNFNIDTLLYYVLRAVAALICIVIHEMSHGYMAYYLGDDTAKRAGRLSFNPIHHIDPLGLILMIVAGFGWAKPVPINMRRFKNPKSGMAITALAGPLSNFVLALISLAIASFIYNIAYDVIVALIPLSFIAEVISWLYTFFVYITMLSVGLGLFNLIPIPPLDGSKILFSFLPDNMYITLLKYERYIMLALFVIVYFGILDTPLYYARNAVINLLCMIVHLPTGAI